MSGGGQYLRRAVLTNEAFDHWPYNLKAVRALPALDLSAPVTCLVGDNGVGKSTILEALALAMGLNAHGGSANVRTNGHQTESGLHATIRLQWSQQPRKLFFLRAETVLDTIAAYEREGGPLAGLTTMSHGESVLALLDRLDGDGLLLLADEPEAGMSVVGQMAVLRRIDGLVQRGAQVIMATHSPVLPAYPGAKIWQLGGDGPQQVPWQQTDSAVLLKSFLGAPDAFLRRLLG